MEFKTYIIKWPLLQTYISITNQVSGKPQINDHDIKGIFPIGYQNIKPKITTLNTVLMVL